MLFISVNVLAQSGSIKGKVIDAKTQTAVEYASVALFKNADSTLLAGQVTKEDGTFSFTGLSQGSYRPRAAHDHAARRDDLEQPRGSGAAHGRVFRLP